MTSRHIIDPTKDHLLTPENSALILIDMQPVQVTSIASMDRREMVTNVVAVAKTAKLFGLPVVISTVNVKSGRNQPTLPQVRTLFPEIQEIDRTTLNAWEDENFRNAVSATGRKKLIFVAIWTEVCLAFPVLSATQDGYDCYPVVDAVGSTSLAAHRAGLHRMMQAGAHPISWTGLICELQRDWAREKTRSDFAKILFAAEGA